MINRNSIFLCHLLNDISLQHLSAVQAETAIIHCQKDRVCFILRGCIDLKEQNFLNKPVDKIR